MRLQSRSLALLGLLALGFIGYQLVGGGLTIPQAGLRVAVVLLVLLTVERVGFPLAKSLVGPSRPPSEDAPPAA